MKGRGSSTPQRKSVPLVAPLRADEVCLELQDYSVVKRSAVEFFKLKNARDPQAQAARLAEQFTKQNRALAAVLDVQIDREYDGNEVRLIIYSGGRVGAIPLYSPTTARPDYGLVVQPRFPWSGIGPMLSEMGWRVSPTPLRLPLLRRSERRVPVWVLALMILVRLRGLLDSIQRRFEITRESCIAPRGAVQWNEYATRSLAFGKVLSIPCRFPDLRDDRLLKGAVRYSVERQLRALESQREHGAFVHRLIEAGQELLCRVQDVPVHIPSSTTLGAWLHRPMRTEHFVDGLQAIEWTVDERGLAGLSDLEGIPWTMPMDQFFEAWVETVFTCVVRRTGGQMRVGRKRETTHPINWDPSYLGSQKSLVPDLMLEWDTTTVIVDAKYKRHWEELQLKSWSRLEEELREQHRHDLLQVLAYANLARTSLVIACLVYPCSAATWHSLCERGRLMHKAQITVGSKSLRLWLTAIPMSNAVEEVSAPLAADIQSALREANAPS